MRIISVLSAEPDMQNRLPIVEAEKTRLRTLNVSGELK